MSKQHCLTATLVAICGFNFVSSCRAEFPVADQKIFAGQGIMVGEVSSTAANVQVRLTKSDKLVKGDLPGASGIVEFKIAEANDDSKTITKFAAAISEKDFIARVSFTKLQPGVSYVCKTRIGATKDSFLHKGPTAQFKTHPGKGLVAPVKFVVVTGMNYAKFHGDSRIDLKKHKIENNTALPPPYKGKDKHLGYPALASILKLKPDFFVGTGDNVYYDTPKKPRAKTLSELRQKWHQQFVQPRYRDLFAKVPTYWMVDDHDYRIDDCDNSGDYQPSVKLAHRLMREQLPTIGVGRESKKTYRNYRVSTNLEIWFVENRMYRSPNSMKDGPEKSIWGKEQKEWLKRTLKESNATFKILISPTPMIGPDDLRKKDNHTNIGGFRHEGDEFFKWLKENKFNKKNFYIICGDRHWQYRSIHPTGIEEFSCGALIDANSRLGRKPGDPKSTDPDAKIKQPYYQTPRSGGFLHVTVVFGKESGPTAIFEFYDEKGKSLHRAKKFFMR